MLDERAALQALNWRYLLGCQIVTQSDFSQVCFVSVGPEHAGQRLDNFLIRHLKGVPKSRIYRLVRKGEVRVNKSRARADSRIQDGDILRIAPIRVAQVASQVAPSGDLGRYITAHVLFEDEGLLIFDKPSGLAVHGGSGISLGAIEALRAERPHEKFLELVHRLDRDTSGCLLFAKKRNVLLALHKAMAHHSIDKSYTTLVQHAWPAGKRTVAAPLQKNQLSSGARIVRVDHRGKTAVTHFSVVKRFADCTLLKATLETGRTHQIRVHCQFSGHPIAGDPKYGDPTFNDQLRKLGLKRLFLHASRLRFKHPLSNEVVTVESPLPSNLSGVIAKL